MAMVHYSGNEVKSWQHNYLDSVGLILQFYHSSRFLLFSKPFFDLYKLAKFTYLCINMSGKLEINRILQNHYIRHVCLLEM
jgi:hypothetical protein